MAKKISSAMFGQFWSMFTFAKSLKVGVADP